MSTPPRPKPIPATIGTIFGGLWALIAAMALPPGWPLPSAALAGLATLALTIRLWRRQQPVAAQPQRLFGRRTYQVAVVLEFLAIYVASVLLPRFGWQGSLIQAVGLIVGLHFIGLWAATRSSQFLGIAAGMCLVSACAIALPATLHLFHLRDFFTGAGNALVLWLGASRSPARVA